MLNKQTFKKMWYCDAYTLLKKRRALIFKLFSLAQCFKLF